MSFSFVTAASNAQGGGPASTFAVTITPGAGNLCVLVVAWGSGTTSDLTSITDNGTGGASWVILNRKADTGNGESAALCYSYGWSVSPTVITANFASPLEYNGISAQAFSSSLGAIAINPIDGSNEQGQHQASPPASPTTNGAKAGAGNLTPSANDCLIFAGIAMSGALPLSAGAEFEPGTGFTEPANAEFSQTDKIGIDSEYMIQTTAAAVNGTFTVDQSVGHLTFMAVFKEGGGVSGVVSKSLIVHQQAVSLASCI